MSATQREFKPDENALSEQVILITGATGGIGQALTRACAGLGATVIACGRKIPALNRLADEVVAAGGPEPLIYPIDLSGATPDDYQTLVHAIEDNLGRLDAIVHLAAEFKGLVQIDQIETQDWLNTFQIGLTAPWLLNQMARPLLAKRDDGRPARILFALDDAAQNRKPYMGAYGISKSGLEAMCSISSEEYESSGIIVSGVSTGPVKTAHRKKLYIEEENPLLKEPLEAATCYLELLCSPD